MIQVQGQQQNKLLDEAAAWIARLRADTVSAQEQGEFSHWLNLSDAHLLAFDEMTDTWETLGAATYSPHAAAANLHSKKTAQTSRSWLPRLNLWHGGLATACVAGLMALVILLPGSPAVETLHYATTIGEQRRITLADGSVVDLNTNTRLQVRYSEARRELALSRGEAYFDVVSNKRAPFVVDVGAGTVTAVGTAFNIYRQGTETRVTVTEGTVRVAEAKDAATPAPNSELASAAQQVLLGKRGVGQVRDLNTSQALAWRHKTLVFDNAPLSEAIDELNRYLGQPVDTSDATLQPLKVSGTFSLEAPQETLRALMASFNLAIVEQQQTQRLYVPTEG